MKRTGPASARPAAFPSRWKTAAWPLALGVLAAGVAIGMYLHRPSAPGSGPAPTAPPPERAWASSPQDPKGGDGTAAPASARNIDGPTTLQTDHVLEAISNTGAPLRADDSGKLVLDAKTRERVEAIVTLIDPQDLYTVVAQETRQLPPEAAAQARALVERYKIYLEEQIGAVAPGFAPANEDEALAQLQAIERLRVQHFGEAAARALFGEETAVTRELIELARVERDPTLTLQQRVERAQAKYQELRRLQAINERQRK
jgi:hypothetical protein